MVRQLDDARYGQGWIFANNSCLTPLLRGKTPSNTPFATLTHDIMVHLDLSLWLLLYANSTIIANQFWVHKYMVRMFAHLFWKGMTSVIAHGRTGRKCAIAHNSDTTDHHRDQMAIIHSACSCGWEILVSRYKSLWFLYVKTAGEVLVETQILNVLFTCTKEASVSLKC